MEEPKDKRTKAYKDWKANQAERIQRTWRHYCKDNQSHRN